MPKPWACYNLNMDKAEAVAFRERWRDVERIERMEAQSITIQDRWRQLNAVKRRATRLGITQKDDDSEMKIFLVWANLRKKHDTA
jgi:hypothetical protein